MRLQHCFALMCIGVMVTAVCVPASAMGIATFENLDEGFLGASFTDPASGITFSNPTYSLGTSVFAAEYSGGPALPPVVPGTYLTGGYSSGQGEE